MYKIAFIVITRNRPYAIMEYIKYSNKLFEENNFGLFIIDGSDNNDTYNIVKSVLRDYIFYFPAMEMSFAERVIYGINSSESEYIYITGDTKYLNVISFNEIKELFELDYDIIEISGRDKKKIRKRIYNSIETFFCDNAWDCTMFGTVFIKRNSFKYINTSDFVIKYKNNLFPHIIYYFNYCNNYDSFHAVYLGHSLFEKNKVKTNDNWPNKLKVFGKEWVECINYLDKKYCPYKKNVIKDHGKYSDLMLDKIMGFYKLRMNGALNKKIMEEHRAILPYITDVSMWQIHIVTIIPRQIAKILYYISRIPSKIFKRAEK